MEGGESQSSFDRIDEGLVEKLVSYLGRHEPGELDFWRELAFLECEFGDLSPLRSALIRELNGVDSPVHRPGGLDETTVRDVALALRRRARAEHGAPPLTAAEETAWLFVEPNYHCIPRKLDPNLRLSRWVSPTREQREAIDRYMRELYPDVVRYWIKVKCYNDSLSASEYRDRHLDGIHFFERLYEAFDRFVPLKDDESWDLDAVEELGSRLGDRDAILF